MKRTSVWCLFARSHLGLALFLPISPIELFGAPTSPWRTGPVRAPQSLVAFSGGYKECSEATLPSLTPRCADLFFLWAWLGCAHVSFSLATHHPDFLMLIPSHGESFSWTICLGVGCVDVGRLLLSLLVLCRVQCFSAPALLMWLWRGLLRPGPRIPHVCCLWRTRRAF